LVIDYLEKLDNEFNTNVSRNEGSTGRTSFAPVRKAFLSL